MHPTEQMVKLLQDGTVNLTESLISIITTAGFNLNSPCKREYDYCINLLKGVEDHQNDKYFVYIAQMDEGDDIWNPQNWYKCSPLARHIPHSIQNMKDLAIEAKAKGGDEYVNFITKTLNVWYEYKKAQYINITKFKKGACNLTLEDMRGMKCSIGVDLSNGGDLCSISFNFLLDDGKYFIHSHSFMPSERVLEHEETDKAPYRFWIEKELITITNGFKTDYKYIINYIKEQIEKYNLDVIMIGFDPSNAGAFQADLEEIAESIPVIQSHASLNDATIDFQLEVESENILYNEENKLLEWSFANAVLHRNASKLVKIDKDGGKNGNKRIDPCDAVICGHKILFGNKEEKIENLDHLINDEDMLKKMGWE